MSYPLGPVSWSIATADDLPVKTDKTKLFHFYDVEENLANKPPLHQSSVIIDGNALLQALVGIPDTFEQLCEKVFYQLPNAKRIDIVTDSYHPTSIKTIERNRRGSGQSYLIIGGLTKIPHNWKEFLSNSKNKQQLLKLLLNEFQKDKFAKKLQNRVINFVYEERCISISSNDGVSIQVEDNLKLYSSQEEADTRIILHLLDISSSTSQDHNIIVRSPDTDVFVLLVKFSQQISQNVLFDTGTGNRRHLVTVKKVAQDIGSDMCDSLPSLHSYTGCDTVSAFVRKGKLLPLRLLKKYPQFLETFKSLGKTSSLDEKTIHDLEHFTCLMYKDNLKELSINRLRYKIFLQRYIPTSGILSTNDGIDMSLLPPCLTSLSEHMKRANYQALIWQKADEQYPDIPSPEGHGWCKDNDNLKFHWCSGSLMPQELIYVLDSEKEAHSEVETENLIDCFYEEESI